MQFVIFFLALSFVSIYFIFRKVNENTKIIKSNIKLNNNVNEEINEEKLIRFALCEYSHANTYNKLINVHCKFLNGEIYASFCHYGPLYLETEEEKESFIKMTRNGFITTDSQPGHTIDNLENTCVYGFEYVFGFMRNDLVVKIVKKIKELDCVIRVGEYIFTPKGIMESKDKTKFLTFNCLGYDTEDLPHSGQIYEEFLVEDKYPVNFHSIRNFHLNMQEYLVEHFTEVEICSVNVGKRGLIKELGKILASM